MKKIIYLLILTPFYSCTVKYYGYVYDIDKKTPICNVRIKTIDSLNITYSNENGCFEIKLKEKVKELVFEKENYQAHNLRTLSIQSGEFMKELPFGDTIYLISKNSKYSRPKTTLPNNVYKK
ncbi:hypothetical protein [Tenacibaculum maritimum]|uniref:hypothetical protein n=1 Tax=Tenacibaculum maritimum TaxID=107401 RepID=UPI001E38B5D4|nr:hypothetical protein [Tenacibaculum maritimum]MCD9564314.1 hypothetical protein [Tenacibaculum maritimum]MCD9567133.1 hypothetical protein [Tenacibaculum maritimum]MCD9580344.1 hypothetical protein [Tenacibaculum maritimum]MCD9598161.1 hypothetical protein [Tenacibaculum maritimum]MCD9615022.1 hypothetical protein [Tenacibaculum maritimum]